MAPPIASERKGSRLVAASALSVLCVFAPNARGQTPGDAEPRAQELFDEARSLMSEGRYSEACPKLEQSQALDPGGGTLLNLGICHEKEGRTATAFRELTDALALAGRDHRADREKTASKHLDALAPQLSRLTVQVSSDVACPDVVVEVDDTALALDDIGKPVPLDPGKHHVSASASGCRPWSTDVELGPTADHQEVSVALLVNPPPPVAAETVAPAPPATTVTRRVPAQEPAVAKESSSSMRVTGYAVGAAGIAAVGVGTYFGVSALVLKNRSDGACHGDSCTTRSGVTDFDDAKTHAHIADIAIGAGLVAIGVGAYLVIRAGSREKPAQTVALSIGGVRSGGIASCSGTF